MTDMTPDYAIARKAMIDSQLRTSGINSEFVLARMNSVAREQFVPEQQRALAYIDRAIALGGGQFLASPVVHGMMLTEAAPTAADSVLIVENGSNYFAELIRPLVKEVKTVTAAEAAGMRASTKPAISLIVVDGAIEGLSKGLEGALAEEGRVVTGVVDNGVTRLAVGRKIAGQVTLQSVADIGMPIISDFDKPKKWSFA